MLVVIARKKNWIFTIISVFPIIFWIPSLRGHSYGGELTRLGGLARLGKMIIITRSYGIFCLSSIKKFVK